MKQTIIIVIFVMICASTMMSGCLESTTGEPPDANDDVVTATERRADPPRQTDGYGNYGYKYPIVGTFVQSYYPQLTAEMIGIVPDSVLPKDVTPFTVTIYEDNTGVTADNPKFPLKLIWEPAQMRGDECQYVLHVSNVEEWRADGRLYYPGVFVTYTNGSAICNWAGIWYRGTWEYE